MVVFSLQEFTMHDTIGCYLDLDKSQISFSKNGADCIAENNRWLFIVTYPELEEIKTLDNIIVFSSLGNELGLAFDIPPNLRNQAFFASCVLKVSPKNTFLPKNERKQTYWYNLNMTLYKTAISSAC